MSIPRSRRTKKILIGLMAAGVTVLGIAATLPANAAAGEEATWIFGINAAPGSENIKSFEIRWTGTGHAPRTACYPISQGETKNFNQTGILGEKVEVFSYPAVRCEGAFDAGIDFLAPVNAGNSVNVTLDGDGAHVGEGGEETSDGHLNMVALGDSFSSGHGASSSYEDNDCKRTNNGYPKVFFDKYTAVQGPGNITQFLNYSCTGATTADVLSKQLPGVPVHTDIVTLTIGGNDAHFAGVAQVCTISSGSDCAGRLNRLTAEKDAIRTPVANVLAEINKKAPEARVFLLGYPEIFDTGDCGFLAIAEENRDKIRSLQVEMNTMLHEIVTASGNTRNTYVDTDSLFETHRVCDSDRWINSVTDALPKLDTAASYHPNAAGQLAMADTLLDAASGGTSF